MMRLSLCLCLLCVACDLSPAPTKAPFRAPLWDEAPGARVKMNKPALSIQGDVRQGDLGGERFQGYLVYGGALTTLRLGVRPLDEQLDPVLVLYGPRREGGTWGSALVLDDDGGGGRAARIESVTLRQPGEYLVMVGGYGSPRAGAYELAVSCLAGCEEIVACPELACEAECASGWRHDARGCQTCVCLDDCEDGCAEVSDCGCAPEPTLVCGVDGQDYLSACHARCAGVEPQRQGACEPGCPALACDLSCPEGFLEDSLGCPLCACVDPCAQCAQTLDPVCTVDQETIPNACLAACRNLEVASTGACAPACGDVEGCNLICPEGFVVDEDGCEICQCAAPSCVEDGLFVCGEDGVTYRSACEAEGAGVEVALQGACPRVCAQGVPCPDKLQCQALGSEPARLCLDEACAGVCVVPSPDVCDRDADCLAGFACEAGVCALSCACPSLYDPVCGVDGQTYLNLCVARCVRIVVEKTGACCAPEALDGCDLQCDNGWDLDIDGCELCSCRQDPVCVCEPEENPVCGEDNRTYRNSCQASCAGLTSWDEGPCL